MSETMMTNTPNHAPANTPNNAPKQPHASQQPHATQQRPTGEQQLANQQRLTGEQASQPPIIQVDHLSITSASGAPLVDDVSFELHPGEKLGLIGQSGSGKSLTAMAIMGLNQGQLDVTGTITFRDPVTGAVTDLTACTEKQLTAFRGKRIAFVFQEPMTALDPLQKVGDQLAGALAVHGVKDHARVLELLEQVALPDPENTARLYPHQLSGGGRQRVLIAMALAHDPDVLICDEPTTALDVTVQKDILDLIQRLVAERQTALLFITHDLGIISQVCDRVVVMNQGRIVETGTTAQVLTAPKADYTRGLLAASDLFARDSQGRFFAAASEEYRPGVALVTRPRGEVGEEIVTFSHVSKRHSRGWFKKTHTDALSDVSFELRRGSRLGIVGGSGSGKTTLLKLLAGLDQPTYGSVTFAPGISRADIHMVFQDPYQSLDPRMTIGSTVEEPLRAIGMPADERAARVREVLAEVGLDESVVSRFPHEFSGGQRQRISLARALGPRPKLLLADEAVSALDVAVRAQVLNLIESVAEEYSFSLVFVSHDLGVVQQLCNEVIVLDRGRLVERGQAQEVFSNPTTEYTRKLVAAVPRIEVPGAAAPSAR